MIGEKLAGLVIALFYLGMSLIGGVVRLIVALLGPTLSVILLALVAGLWWFGYLPKLSALWG